MKRSLATILALSALAALDQTPPPPLLRVDPEPEPLPPRLRHPEPAPVPVVFLPPAPTARARPAAAGATVDRSVVWPTRCHRCRQRGPQHAPRTVVRTTRSGRAVETIVCDVGTETREMRGF